MIRSTLAVLAAAFLLFTLPAPAQEKKLACGSSTNRSCEMRELPLPASGSLAVDAAPNGGVTIVGWDKNEILVRAKVETWEGVALSQVSISTTGGKVKADGPHSVDGHGSQHWSVSYEVFTPKKIDLDLDSVNGGIHVTDVRGSLDLHTVNGGITLSAVNGSVKGNTVNGGVHVDIAGSRWDGTGLDVHTVNGGVTLTAPAAFAADVSAQTVHGGISSDFEGLVQPGRSWGPKHFEFKIGGGGAPVKVQTVNGGVKIRKKA